MGLAGAGLATTGVGGVINVDGVPAAGGVVVRSGIGLVFGGVVAEKGSSCAAVVRGGIRSGAGRVAGDMATSS